MCSIVASSLIIKTNRKLGNHVYFSDSLGDGPGANDYLDLLSVSATQQKCISSLINRKKLVTPWY